MASIDRDNIELVSFNSQKRILKKALDTKFVFGHDL